jgi:hypothetical protein
MNETENHRLSKVSNLSRSSRRRLTRWKRFSGSLRMIRLSHHCRSRLEQTMALFNARELHNGV